MTERSVSISTGTIFKVIAILIGFWFFYLIRDIFAMLFVAIVLASALDPWIDALQKRGIPRVVGILSVYILLLGIVSMAITLIVPPIVKEVGEISESFPAYWEKATQFYRNLQELSTTAGGSNTVQDSLQSFQETISKIGGGIFTASSRIFGGVISFFAVLVMVFYLTVGESGIKEFIRALLPPKYQPYLIQKVNQVQTKMGQWIRGQIILSVVIFLMTFVGLLILGVEYALVLALIAGLAEVIPVVGPILAAIPAVFLTLANSPIKALLVAVFYIIVQQAENQIIVPKVMQRAVGLHPLVILIMMLIGAKLVGILGILLAVPTATIIKIFLSDFFEGRQVQGDRIEE